MHCQNVAVIKSYYLLNLTCLHIFFQKFVIYFFLEKKA